MTLPPSALVLLADGAEEIEVAIVVDVLRRGGVAVTLAGLSGTAPVTCSRGLCIVPDVALASATADHDVVVLPGGGGGAEALAASPAVGRLLRTQAAAGRLIAAICAAPIVLCRHGIAPGESMTCHPSVAEQVARHGRLVDDRVVVGSGLVTSQGPGTAFEFALRLLAKLCGEGVAHEVAAPMVLRAM